MHWLYKWIKFIDTCYIKNIYYHKERKRSIKAFFNKYYKTFYYKKNIKQILVILLKIKMDKENLACGICGYQLWNSHNHDIANKKEPSLTENSIIDYRSNAVNMIKNRSKNYNYYQEIKRVIKSSVGINYWINYWKWHVYRKLNYCWLSETDFIFTIIRMVNLPNTLFSPITSLRRDPMPPKQMSVSNDFFGSFFKIEYLISDPPKPVIYNKPTKSANFIKKNQTTITLTIMIWIIMSLLIIMSLPLMMIILLYKLLI